MKTWTDITTTALMGTERKPLPSIVDAGDPLSAALAIIVNPQPNTTSPSPIPMGEGAGGEGPESALLSAAALITVYRKVGAMPAVADVDLSTPAPPDVHPACSDKAAHVVAVLLAGGASHAEIVVEAVRLLKQGGLRVPHALLPDLLAWAGRNKGVDVDIVPVIDSRGVWLAAQNPDWSFAAQPLIDAAAIDAAAWADIPNVTRRAIIAEVGKRDPAEARRLLTLTWATDSAEERSTQLTSMREWVTPADEEFLEQCLDDRSATVRSAAADLLTRLPDSRYVRRMIDRSRSVLKMDYHFQQGHVLHVTLPTDRDDSMKRDGIQADGGVRGSSNLDTGIRSGWVRQIIAAIPTGHWSSVFGLSPGEFMALAHKSEWSTVLTNGLAQAANRHFDAEWTMGALRYVVEKRSLFDVLKEMGPAINRIPIRDLEPIILDLLARTQVGDTRSVVYWFIGAHRDELPVTLAKPILDKIGQTLSDFSDHQTLSMAITLMRETALKIPPAMVDDFAALVDHAQTLVPPVWHRQMDQALDILRLRKELHESINNS